MLFSYNWLQTFFGDKLPEPKVLADLLTRRSFEVEGFKKFGADTILDIAVLSNRAADCFSHLGMARECAAVLGLRQKPVIKKRKVASGSIAVRSLINLDIANADLCPRYCAKMIEGIKIGPSPKWVQDRLSACDLRPINNIVDAANYVMLEIGQPLHTFDYDKIAVDAKTKKAKTISVRLARKGEKIEALDDKTYPLDETMLLIADASGPLVIAGIKGGRRAEISDNTKTIIIESANFNRQSIRRTSKKLGLRTDASARYEHGLDPNMAQIAIERAAELMAQLAGGRVLTGMADFYPKKTGPKWLTLDLEQAERLLGVAVQAAQSKKILEALGFQVRKGKGSNIEALVPTFRTDVNLPQDLIEEIGRISGYENIAGVLPDCSLIISKVNYSSVCAQTIRQAFKEAGFYEAYCYSFVSANDWKLFGFDGGDIISVKNPLNIDFEYLRPSLLMNLLKKSASVTAQQTDYFEIGRVFNKKSASQPVMAGAVCHGTFFEAKAAAELALSRLGASQIEFRPADTGNINTQVYAAESTAIIYSGKKMVGVVGQVAQKIAKAYGYTNAPAAIELDCGVLEGLLSEIVVYKPESLFPPVIRDLAVLVPGRAHADDVLSLVRKAAGALLKESNVFEAYAGKGVPEGKKNVALTLAFQSFEKNLTASEIDVFMKSIIEKLETQPDWIVRK